MNELESKVKEMIILKYGNLKKFSDKINMPWTTLDSILKRGIANSNISNVLKITRELEIDSEKLIDGKIIPTRNIPTVSIINSEPEKNKTQGKLLKEYEQTKKTLEIMAYYKKLNDNGKEIATEQVRLLTLDEKYTKPDTPIATLKDSTPDYLRPVATHERTDIEVTDEMR